MDPIRRMRDAADSVQESVDVFPAFTGPAPDKHIDAVAKELSLPIEGSYREFCRLLGDQNDFGFCGVNTEYPDAGTLWATRYMRRERGLSENYLVVWIDEGYNEAIVLDCGQPQKRGEFPVYALYTADWRESLTSVAGSFVDAFEAHYGLRPPKDKAQKGQSKTATRAKKVAKKSTSVKGKPATTKRAKRARARRKK